MQRARRVSPKADWQLLTIVNSLTFQLCAARYGAMATATAAGAPTVRDVAQAGTAAVFATAARLLRGLLNASGARILEHHHYKLYSTPRAAVTARDHGFSDRVVSEPFFLRPVAPTQPGIAVAAAYYRMPVKWDCRQTVMSPRPEATLDGMPGVQVTPPDATLAVPLLLPGAELVGNGGEDLISGENNKNKETGRIHL